MTRLHSGAPVGRWTLPYLVTLTGAGLAAGCGRGQPEARVLSLEAVRPTDAQGVFLNEELVFTFSAPVDPSSVTAESLRIVSAGGEPARGEWTVRGRQARFQPSPTLARDLSDGGYRPGTRYTVTLSGFPRLGCVRGLEGEPLARARTWSFETVGTGGEQRLFEDASPARGQRVRLSPHRSMQMPEFEEGEPVLLFCDEPLDPSTLDEKQFWIVADQTPRPVRRAADDYIPVRASFVRNDPESARDFLDPCAVIEFMPAHRLEAERQYWLRVARPTSGDPPFEPATAGLTDFQGNRVWTTTPLNQGLRFRVTESPFERRSELKLSFLEDDRTRFSPVEIPWADGTAYWGTEGRIEVRYPAAAGSGADGEVSLGPQEPRVDVQATRLVLEQGRNCSLAPGGGLRVLRAQGRLEIRGTLQRADTRRDQKMVFAEGQDLSTWLDRARESGEDWTVLIAGGDLVIDGSVSLDTPLLLVAGGWIRIDGSVECRVDPAAVPRPIHKLGRGGGLALDPLTSPANLVMDEPRPDQNPLRVALTFAALSSPIPSGDQPRHWLRAVSGGHEVRPAVQGAPKPSEYRVRFLQSEGPLVEEEAVIHPQLLKTPGAVRLLIELVVRPGQGWDPPSVDFVDLSWE